MTSENLTIGSIAYVYENNSAVAIKVLGFTVTPHTSTMHHSLDVKIKYLSAKDGQEHEKKIGYGMFELYANICGDGTLTDKYETYGTQITPCLQKNISLAAKNSIGQITFGYDSICGRYTQFAVNRYKWENNSAKLKEMHNRFIGELIITKECASITPPTNGFEGNYELMLENTFATKQECESANKASVFTFD